MRIFALLVALTLCACAGPQLMRTAPPAADNAQADISRVFVATTRGSNATGTIRNNKRAEQLTFRRYDVSVPPIHAPGQVEWPRKVADPAQHFVVTDQSTYSDAAAFNRAITSGDTGRETFVFVHGFNTTHDQAVYRAAQMLHDFEVPGPGVLYSWPSKGRISAYAFDRDSVLVARDDLAQLLQMLSADGRRVALVAHSMGAQLLMEALRTMAVAQDSNLDRSIAAVLLISPDLDKDVFRAQARAIGTLPRPFYVVGTPRDRALRLSGFLTGREGRLGSLSDANEFADLGVTAVDVTELSSGEGIDHDVLITSPAAIAILEKLDENFDLFDAEQPPGAVLLDRLFPSGE